MIKKTLAIFLILSLLICLFSCKNPTPDPNEGEETLEGIEAIICNGHPVYSQAVLPYAHRYVYNLDKFYSRLGELGKDSRAIEIDYSGDDVLVFYQITGTNVNVEAPGITGFLTEESEATVETYLVLRNYHCEADVDSQSSGYDSSCNLRFYSINECFSDIKRNDKYDYFVDWAGADDFAIIRIFGKYNTKITDPSLLSFELDNDTTAYKNYDVYYGSDLAFKIISCVYFDDELISFIKNNLVYHE